MEFRSNYPAFNGDFSVVESDDDSLVLDWSLDEFSGYSIY